MKDSYLIWIFAGEASGDIYGARLATELRKMLPREKLRIAGMGGHLMRDAGVEIMVDSTELGVVGLIEVFENIGTFARIFQNLKKTCDKRTSGCGDTHRLSWFQSSFCETDVSE